MTSTEDMKLDVILLPVTGPDSDWPASYAEYIVAERAGKELSS